ncbi:MAG: PAS domain S-box protein [Betaproteobacteria bacterium]|nr:PAS domain S-box protein [Betaproteobacteria bacterium]
MARSWAELVPATTSPSGDAPKPLPRQPSDIPQQRFATAFNASPIAASIARVDDGRILEVNRNYERDFGWTPADLIGHTSLELGFVVR